MFSAADSQWMAHALRLAERGLYGTSPNPRVGCVLVRNGEMVGEGWHARAGEPHAEVHALHMAGSKAQDATAYVTLEPCSHHGRTPPCADALITAGVARVVVAMQDPNPLVAGQGLEKLRKAGIKVEFGIMEAAARELNIGFHSRMTRRMPWVRSKIAGSLDGRTALNNGTSKWITGEAARQDVQHWRARSCVVLSGIGTVLADDPQLNVRGIDTPRQPLRAVVDSTLRLPPAARLMAQRGLLVYTAVTDAAKAAVLEQAGTEVMVLPGADGQVDLQAVLHDLAARGANEVLVEAGSKLNGRLLQQQLVDELLLYLAPQFLGDRGRGMAALGELTTLDHRIAFAWRDVRHVGGDLRILATIKKDGHV